jgi:hypothetical protein
MKTTRRSPVPLHLQSFAERLRVTPRLLQLTDARPPDRSVRRDNVK